MPISIFKTLDICAYPFKLFAFLSKSIFALCNPRFAHYCISYTKYANVIVNTSTQLRDAPNTSHTLRLAAGL